MTRLDRPGARELLDRVLDPGSWTSWDEPAVQPPGISAAYAEELRPIGGGAGFALGAGL